PAETQGPPPDGAPTHQTAAAKGAPARPAHADTIKKAVATQAAWQTGKQIVKCPLKDEEEECPPQ
ncbi:hypothetical protein CDO43_39220, partial [Pseudomonas aeruginosa]